MPNPARLLWLALLFALFAFPAKAQIVNAGGSSGPTSNSPSVINVRNTTYGGGAFGDTQSNDTCTVNTSTTQVCTGANFTQADVGKTFCAGTQEITQAPCSLITQVTNGTTIVTASASTNNFSGVTGVWGHPDDAAVAAAVTAWLACSHAVNQGGNIGILTPPCALYFPTGAYLLVNQPNGAVNEVATVSGLQMYGDGPNLSKIYYGSGGTFTSATALFNFGGGATKLIIHDLTVDGANGAFPAIPIFQLGGETKMTNVIVQRALNSVGITSSSIVDFDFIQSIGNSKGFVCSACQGKVQNWIFSNNNNGNTVIGNVSGPPASPGLIMEDGLGDECGSFAGGCTQVNNSVDVWFLGARLFGTSSGSAIQIDGTSYVHWDAGLAAVFGTDTNVTGAKILAGGTLQAADVRFTSSGTGVCVNNAGLFKDIGGNSCGSTFNILSGTSTTTTAVLTATVSGVSTNCAVGDTLVVEAAGIAGYNGYYAGGITAVAASTVTYTTIGSSMGALSAGGVFTCQNILNYTGNLPVASLTHTWNTCYNTLGTVATIVVCNQFLDQPLNITHMKASSNATTTCATAPLVTISDGTRTQSLTLTTGKSSWDSSVDTSVGFPAIPVKGTNDYHRSLTGAGAITVTYDLNGLAACATPPTNLSVTYNAQSIFDN